MKPEEMFVVLAWFSMPVHAIAFLVLFGWPGRYRDRTMAWHLWLTTLIAGLEPVGFLLASLSVWPAAIIYAGSLAVMWWRIALLIQARRRERRPRNEYAPMEEDLQ